ncbi:hypothetical protein Tco_0673740 [Tanacetum coccineum]
MLNIFMTWYVILFGSLLAIVHDLSVYMLSALDYGYKTGFCLFLRISTTNGSKNDRSISAFVTVDHNLINAIPSSTPFDVSVTLMPLTKRLVKPLVLTCESVAIYDVCDYMYLYAFMWIMWEIGSQSIECDHLNEIGMVIEVMVALDISLCSHFSDNENDEFVLVFVEAAKHQIVVLEHDCLKALVDC